MFKGSVKIICDYRESFANYSNVGFFNDHQDFETFQAIEAALLKAGYNGSIFGGVKELLHAYEDGMLFQDVLFLNLSDGLSQRYSRVQVPIICDLLDVPYTGGDPFAVALASNKHYSKLAALNIGIPAPRGILVTPDDEPLWDQLPEASRFIVKPNSEGSSVGITQESVCESLSNARILALKMLDKFSTVLIEEYIPGYDATTFIVGNGGDMRIAESLIIEHHNKVLFEEEVISIDDYANHGTRSVPALDYLPKKTIKLMEDFSKKLAMRIGAYDFARIDYRVTPRGDVYFLEINTVPAIHRDSQAGAVCAMLGIDLSRFIEEIISVAVVRLKLN